VTRIIAGTYGGRRLATPAGPDTRPTADRVREAMFSGLDATHVLYGRRFLDLYAGSGAVGLEAASRGAEHVLLVESDPKAIRVIRENVAALGVGDVVMLAAQRVTTALAVGPPPAADPPPAAGRPSAAAGGFAAAGRDSAASGKGYDIVFADPPYDLGERDVTAMLDALVGHGWINAGGLVILERSKRSPEPTWVRSVTGERSRRYGEAMLWYGRRS
jgi:16S rRNA (guanine966-N2)-methyltransferase